MSIEQLTETIVKTKALAESKPGNNPLTYTTKLGHIKRAKEDLKELYMEYRAFIKDSAIFILVTGGQTSQFVNIAKNDFECFEVNGEEFYEEITKDINERMYTDTASGPGLFDLISSAFEDIAMDMGIMGYRPLLFESKFKKKLNGKKDLLEVTQKAFNDKVGSEVVGVYAIDRVATQAVNEGFTGRLIPIILHTKNETLIKDFSRDFRQIFGNVFIVSAGKVTKNIKDNSLLSLKTITVEKVKEALTKVKENIN